MSPCHQSRAVHYPPVTRFPYGHYVALLTPRDIDELLRAHGLRASKALGQHFLADPNTARRIARLADVGTGDRVVEVGPGIGSLTLALAETGADVVAIERDRHVLPILETALADANRVRVVEADALEVDFARVLDGEPDRWTMVSNLPYNVATPIVVRFLEEVPQVDRMLVMVQSEVAERLAAAPGERVAGGVTIKVAYYAEAEIVGRVPPTVFVPRPRVESALLAVRRRPVPPVQVDSSERLFRLVKAGFGQRRKTLRRALRSALGDSALEVLERAGVDPGARAETLDLEAWAALTRAAASSNGGG